MKQFLFLLILLPILCQSQVTTWIVDEQATPEDNVKQVEKDSLGNSYVLTSHSIPYSSNEYSTFNRYDKFHYNPTSLFQAYSDEIKNFTIVDNVPFLCGAYWENSYIIGYKSPAERGNYIARIGAKDSAHAGKYVFPYSKLCAVASEDGALYYTSQYDRVFVFGNDTLLSDTASGCILLKCDTSLNVLWFKHFSLPTFSDPVLLARNHRIFLLATYQDSVRVGSLVTKPDTGTISCFALCMNDQGQPLWLRNTTENKLTLQLYSATVDAAGNLYTGIYAGGEHSITKMGANGTLQWQKTLPYILTSIDFGSEHMIIAGTDGYGGQTTVDLRDSAFTLLQQFSSASVRVNFVRGIGGKKYRCAGSVYEGNPYFPLAPSPPNCYMYTCNGSDGFVREFKDTTTTMSISQDVFADHFYIGPNPSRIFKISVGGWALSANCELINSQGVKVKEKMIDREEMELDLTELPAGIYLVRISGRDQVQCKKIVVD